MPLMLLFGRLVVLLMADTVDSEKSTYSSI